MIKIGIIGLGLIGGSILKKLSLNSNYELFCVTKSSKNEALNYTKSVSDDIKIVQNCDIVFVCSRIDKTLECLNELNKFLNENTIVCDVASIKKEFLNKKYNFHFILTHPMAGSEKTGFVASKEELFNNSKWLIEEENEILIEIVNNLGAKPMKIDMNFHDKLVAQISHLPTILASLLFNLASENAKQIASSGFRDMTRLAMTQENLINSMFENNMENIELYLKNLIKDFENLKKMSSNERINLFKNISIQREKTYDKDGKNIFDL